MALPTIKGYQLEDQTITSDDLNISTSGKSVIVKISEQANSGIKLYSSTGADPGTGEVKLMVDTDYLDGIYLRSETNPYVSAFTTDYSTSGSLGLTRVNGTNLNTSLYSIRTSDVRSTAQVPGSDGTTTYFPLPNDTMLNQGMHTFFNMQWGGASWGTSIVCKGWANVYTVWSISGPAGNSTPSNDFYLRVGADATWDDPVRIWHSGDFSQSDINTWNTGYTLPTASTTVLGGVKVDGSTITISGGGVISATGSGSVTSVGLSLPSSVFTVTGSPVTGSGTLTGAYKSQTAGKVFASPASSSGVPTFRSLVAGDIPSLPSSKITGLATVATSGSYNDLSNTPSPYTLPTASSSVLGGIKVGSGLSISSGTLSVTWESESSTGKFLATPPYPASGGPVFRTIQSVDLPSLPVSKLIKDSPSTYIGTSFLGSGTADSTTYLRGDGTWQTVSSGGSQSLQDVTSVGPTTSNAIKITGLTGINTALNGSGMELFYNSGSSTINSGTRSGSSISYIPLNFNASAISANCNITATAFYESSSRKLKKNIKTFERNATELLKLVKIREFDFKSTGTHHIGIIAEETDAVFSTEKHNSFDLASTLGVLIKGFQELEQRVSKLESPL